LRNCYFGYTISTIYRKLKQTSRQYFKFPNNAKIWTSIMDIIDILQLKMEIFKVDAHASDKLNNYVDRKVKLIHDQSSDYGLILCNQPLLSFNYIPSWNNIEIEQSLRKFLTLMTNVTNLETFLNLNRNEKYRKLEVDFEMTFAVLKGEQKELQTDFKLNKIKRRKIQLLIEEIPCIMQVRKSLNSVYKDHLCPFCEDEEEDFNHFWTCSSRLLEINTLISDTKKIFQEIINGNITSDNNKISFIQINSLNLWDININDNSFMFIDLIKGFILKNLIKFIETLPLDVLNKTMRLNILLSFKSKFLDKIWEFWKVHCEKMKEVDESLGITRRIKKEEFGKDCFYKLHAVSEIPKYKNLYGLMEQCYFGNKALGFIIEVYLN
jgi:hypothetical protein